MALLQCPYNEDHKVKAGNRFARHVTQCRKKHPDVILLTCLFNYDHYVKPGDEIKHLYECKNADWNLILELESYKNNKRTIKDDSHFPSITEEKTSADNDDFETVSLAPDDKVNSWLNGVPYELEDFCGTDDSCEEEVPPPPLSRYDSIDSLGAASHIGKKHQYSVPPPATSVADSVNSAQEEKIINVFKTLQKIRDVAGSQSQITEISTTAHSLASSWAEHKRGQALEQSVRERKTSVPTKEDINSSDDNLSCISALAKSYLEHINNKKTETAEPRKESFHPNSDGKPRVLTYDDISDDNVSSVSALKKSWLEHKKKAVTATTRQESCHRNSNRKPRVLTEDADDSSDEYFSSVSDLQKTLIQWKLAKKRASSCSGESVGLKESASQIVRDDKLPNMKCKPRIHDCPGCNCKTESRNCKN